MKTFMIPALLLITFSAHAGQYCDISFSTEQSARPSAGEFSKVMLESKYLLEAKGFQFDTDTPGFDLDIWEEGNVVHAWLVTPRGEHLKFTEKHQGIEKTVKKIFQRMPKCIEDWRQLIF